MNLFLDSETSGLQKPDLDPLDPSQPHLVQLGAQLFDRQWIKRAHLTLLIKPNGWEIEAEAQAVHGISTSTCHRYGVELGAALVSFRALALAANRIIGHNLHGFDRQVIAAAIKRAGGEGVWWARCGAKMFCTMEAGTPVLKLPGEYGFKFPSLEEAVAGLCPGADLPVKHDADSDIAATVAVYRALVDGGHAIDVKPFDVQL